MPGTALAYPSSLPPPLPDYEDALVDTRKEFVTESGHARRRNRMSTALRRFKLNFQYTQEQYDVFVAWFNNTLQNGLLRFDIQLLDDDETPTWFTVRILKAEYTADSDEVMNWTVSFVVLSQSAPFAVRTPSSAELIGYGPGDGLGVGTLAAPGVNLRGLGAGTGTGTGYIPSDLRGIGSGTGTGTGELSTGDARETEDSVARDTEDSLARETE